jgi:hypothetical protein
MILITQIFNAMNKPYHLIETFSGKTIARASDPRLLKNEIAEKFAGNYTLHHEIQGWFAPATILFKQHHKPNPQ